MKRIKLSQNKAPQFINQQMRKATLIPTFQVKIQRWRRNQTAKRRNFFFFCRKVNNINKKIRQTNTETIELKINEFFFVFVSAIENQNNWKKRDTKTTKEKETQLKLDLYILWLSHAKAEEEKRWRNGDYLRGRIEERERGARSCAREDQTKTVLYKQQKRRRQDVLSQQSESNGGTENLMRRRREKKRGVVCKCNKANFLACLLACKGERERERLLNGYFLSLCYILSHTTLSFF